MTIVVEPRFIVESSGFNNERVAVPLPDGTNQPGRFQFFWGRTAVGEI